MKHKPLQDFANVCCQMFLTSLSNQDRINLVIFGSGTLHMDFLEQKCTHNKLAISPLLYCVSYGEWLRDRCQEHRIDGIVAAELIVEAEVETTRNTKGGSLGWLSTRMELACSSRIASPERAYTATLSENKEWGLGQLLVENIY